MVCAYCASNNIVTIQGQGFCVNCGKAQSAAGPVKVAGVTIKPAFAKLASQPLGGALKLEPRLDQSAPPKSATPTIVKNSPTTERSVSITTSPAISRHKSSRSSEAVTTEKPAITRARSIAKPVSETKLVASTQTAPKHHLSDLRRSTPTKAASAGSKPAALVAVAIKSAAPAQKPPLPSTVSARGPASSVAPSQDAAKARRPSKRRNKAGRKTDRKAQPKSRPIKSPPIVTTNALFSGLLAAGIAAGLYLMIHTSRAASLGGYLHYLAGRGLHLKLMLAALTPAAVVALGLVLALWLWQRASTIYTLSRAYDHRPIDRKAAYQAGFNAGGALSLLTGLGLLVGVTWLAVVVLVIRSISGLPLAYWLVSALGVVASFALVLVGLWLLTVLTLGAYLVVLSGQKLTRSLRQAVTIATREYAYAAGTALGLILLASIALAVTAASFVALSGGGLHLAPTAVALGGALVAGALFGWLASFSIKHWTRRYRQSTADVFGSHKLALYRAGRSPQPISRTGIVITLAWWLGLAAGAGLLLWHWQVDPTGLLAKLAAVIY